MGNRLDNDKLSGRELAFCREYVRLWDGAKAAVSAGYKERQAAWRAAKILQKPAAQQEIRRLCAAAVAGFGGDMAALADGEEILRFLTAVMRGEVRDGKGAEEGAGALPKVSERTKAAELLGRNQRLFGGSAGRDSGECVVRILGEGDLQ